ncbi:hypothetical protein CVD28_23080 [Bacillus sp. M6-12]|uniref:5' nucleotidase, NT5C type n=1 Tax=Bacillus sp. M6-12 TaxID=2054166 RepID=UPI000C7697C2|nr:hypothetical protein [Bacillus sp. M6-12]PLS15215.1 hypothetical protein CVD28_23080 [Bacillus sp. M6-12]
MKRRFGIDIDGTVTRPDTFIPYLNKAFQLNLTLNDITQYDFTPFVNVPKETFAKWFLDNESAIYAESQVAEGAREALHHWVNAADLFFISARNSRLHSITEKWFTENELKYHHIELIGSHDKVETAKKLKVDIFFEDKHDNAVDIAEECGIPVILFNTPYNQDPIPDGVIRVNDWEEAKKWVDSWLHTTTITG